MSVTYDSCLHLCPTSIPNVWVFGVTVGTTLVDRVRETRGYRLVESDLLNMSSL